MNDTETIEAFAALFAGRTDAYGHNEGRMVPNAFGDTVEQGTRPHHMWITRHLVGLEPIGVYPLMDDGNVWWGCTDLDNGEDDLVHAKNLATLLEAGGVNAWVERSRSKGFHVWTFASEPVPAETMRNALLAAHQRLGIPAKEVNPKQTSMDGLKGFGNYVRLPYPGVLNGEVGTRQVMLFTDDSVMPLYTFVHEAGRTRSNGWSYQKLADKYTPPPPRENVYVDTEHSAELDDIVSTMGKDLRCAFTYGPKGGHDRSSSLARMAYLAREDGLSASDAFMVMRDADRRWGKFFDRPDGDDQLLKMIERAYG